MGIGGLGEWISTVSSTFIALIGSSWSGVILVDVVVNILLDKVVQLEVERRIDMQSSRWQRIGTEAKLVHQLVEHLVDKAWRQLGCIGGAAIRKACPLF